MLARIDGMIVAVSRIEQWVVDVYFDPIERDGGLNGPAGTSFLEFENAEYFELFQVRMNVRHVAVDESGGHAHALRLVASDCPDQFEANRGQGTGKVVVTPELLHCSFVSGSLFT